MKQTFPITGMHCAGCAANLTRVISKVAGVNAVKVTYTTDQAEIDFDPARIDWSGVRNAVRSIGGYDIILPDSTPSHSDHSAHDHQQQAVDAKKKVIIGGILSVIIFFGEMFSLLPREIVFVLTSVVMGYSGREFFVNTWMGLKHFSANMDTLIAMGTGAAYVYSAAVTFWPQLLGEDQPVYFETAAVIITLVILGRYLEHAAKGRASAAIKKLLGLQAKKAILLIGNRQKEVEISAVKVGDRLLVKPGAKIPVDAVVVSGRSYVDESLVTGESVPVKKGLGDKVIGSTINKQGLLVVRAAAVGEATLLANIIRLVNEAQSSQAPIQKLADKISGIFVPVVIVIALLAFSVWYFIFGLSFAASLVIAITVLIISCPCALGLATPISIMVGTGRGAEAGILIKNAEKLQIAGKIRAIIFDKTGTLTKGEFGVTDVIALSKIGKKNILQLAGSLELGSDHPIAAAIVSEAKKLKLKLSRPQNFINHEGWGISGKLGGSQYSLGKIDFKSLAGKTVVGLKKGDQLLGVIGLADEPKPEAKALIGKLQQQGLAVWMISGDNQVTAAAIGKRLGIAHVLANVMPADKVNRVKELQRQYPVVAMVGDGVNDAPALAQSNVGMVMATGTDVAIEAGDITLLRGDINLVSQAIALSRATMANIKQNLFWAFGYNTVLIPVAAGILLPWGVSVSPVMASAAMAFSSLSVVFNALRLKQVVLH